MSLKVLQLLPFDMV